MEALAALVGLVAEETMVEQTVAVARAVGLVADMVGMVSQVAEGGCKSHLAGALGEMMGRADP